MSLSRREKMLIAVLVLAASAYLLDHFWLQPLNARSSQLEATALSLQTAWEQNENVYTRYGSIDEQEEIIADYAAVRAQVPEEPMIADIIEFIESVAMETSTAANSVRYDAQSETKKAAANPDNEMSLREIGFTINIRGSRSGLLVFLQRVEDAPRLYNITRTKIKAGMADPSLIPAREGEGDQSTAAPAESDRLAVLNTAEPDLYELELEITAYYRE